MKDIGKLFMAPMAKIQEPAKPVREKITEEGLEELSKSIAKNGLENPIKLRSVPNGYEIVTGNRRYLAVKSLGWPSIPAILKEVDDHDIRLRRIHENLHREDMSPIEEGRNCQALIDEEGYSLKDLAKMCSKSESWVSGRLALLEMPVELREAVDVGALSVSAARELAAITDDDARAYYIEYAIKSGATAQLCAFWRGRWEVEKTMNDPSSMSQGAQLLTPPPMEVEMPCNWCDGSIPISLISHLRVCPKCLDLLLRTKAIAKQEAHEAARAEAGAPS